MLFKVCFFFFFVAYNRFEKNIIAEKKNAVFLTINAHHQLYNERVIRKENIFLLFSLQKVLKRRNIIKKKTGKNKSSLLQIDWVSLPFHFSFL